MSRKPFRAKENKHIFNVLLGMILGGFYCLMIILNVDFEGGTGFEEKTLWEWLDLFLVPSILLGGSLALFLYTKKAQEQRSTVEQAIALDNQREALMNAYIELITGLFLKDETDLVGGENGGKSEQIARAHTLDLFRRVDGTRKGMVLRFLYDTELIFQEECVVELRGADLSEIQLEGADLRRTMFSKTDMRYANLRGAKLSGSNLKDTNLQEATLVDAELIECDLRRVWLSRADLRSAILTRANLKMAELDKSDLSDAFLEGADLQGAKLCSCNIRAAYLMDASMQKAILRGADLTGAYLNGADLSESDMTDADFSNAVLSRVILVGSTITKDQLNSAKSIEGAILPQGNET